MALVSERPARPSCAFVLGGATFENQIRVLGMDVTILLPGFLLRNRFVIDSIGTQKSAL